MLHKSTMLHKLTMLYKSPHAWCTQSSRSSPPTPHPPHNLTAVLKLHYYVLHHFHDEASQIGLTRTIHLYVYTVYTRYCLSREITIHTAIYGADIRFWPTLFTNHLMSGACRQAAAALLPSTRIPPRRQCLQTNSTCGGVSWGGERHRHACAGGRRAGAAVQTHQWEGEMS